MRTLTNIVKHWFFFFSENAIVGYLHDLSKIKTSKNNNQYFDLKIQTSTNIYRTVCFSPEKHPTFKRKYESSSPIKLTKFQLKNNDKTSEQELVINKRTKLQDPSDKESEFDYQPLNTEQKQSKDTTAEEILDGEPNTYVNICGRISFTGETKTLNVNSKSLQMQEALFTDDTGSIRTVLWENDIHKVTSKHCYDIKNISVREYQDSNYLTFNKHTTVQEVTKTIERPDDLSIVPENQTINFPPDGGVNYVQRFRSCNKCHTKLPADSENKIIQCSDCKLSQLKSKCKTNILASALFINESKQSISLQMFDNVIEQLYTIYKEMNPNTSLKSFSDITDNDIIEVLLTVEATAIFNAKNTIVTVQKL